MQMWTFFDERMPPLLEWRLVSNAHAMFETVQVQTRALPCGFHSLDGVFERTGPIETTPIASVSAMSVFLKTHFIYRREFICCEHSIISVLIMPRWRMVELALHTYVWRTKQSTCHWQRRTEHPLNGFFHVEWHSSRFRKKIHVSTNAVWLSKQQLETHKHKTYVKNIVMVCVTIMGRNASGHATWSLQKEAENGNQSLLTLCQEKFDDHAKFCIEIQPKHYEVLDEKSTLNDAMQDLP